MDIRNILNRDGGVRRTSPSQDRSASISIPNDRFVPPPRPQRAYSTLSDASAVSQHDILQSPLAPSSGFGSPEFQRQSLPGQAQPRATIRTSPELRRESIVSMTPTTARSSPDFPHDILNNGTAQHHHSSPIERKSSTPGPLHVSDQRSHPSMNISPRQTEQFLSRTTPDPLAGQKRKAEGLPDTLPFQKQPRTDTAMSMSNGQLKPGLHNFAGPSPAPSQLTPNTQTPISKSPSPSTRSDQKMRLNDTQPRNNRQRPTEIPPWATRVPLGRRRIVSGSSLESRPPKLDGRPPQASTPEVKHIVIERAGKQEPNITGLSSSTSITRVVSEWLWQNVISQDQFPASGPARASWEIEAKLGTILNKDTDQRYRNGAMTECVLAQELHNIRFDSGLSAEDFKNLNAYLNKEVARSQQPGRLPISYSHPQEIDTFYQIRKDAREQLPPVVQHYLNQSKHPPKLRVTRSKKANNPVTAKIIKARMSDYHILCPQNRFDIRISISLEISWNSGIEDLGETLQDQRDKDRLSYKHQASHIDVTQVKTATGLMHEVEVELDVDMLKVEAAKLDSEGTAPFEGLVMQLIENAMVLNRAAAADSLGSGGR